MSILKFLGLAREPEGPGAPETETVRKIVRQLDALPPERARYLAAFAYLLSRVAHADLEVSNTETQAMERLVSDVGGLPEAQAVLVVEIAKSQSRLSGGTENFLVTREFKEVATPEERRRLLSCLFAVSAADDSVSGTEENQVRQIANELGFSHAEFVAARMEVRDKRDVLKGLPPSG